MDNYKEKQIKKWIEKVKKRIKEIEKWIKKWFFLESLLLYGFVFFTVTENWQLVSSPCINAVQLYYTKIQQTFIEKTKNLPQNFKENTAKGNMLQTIETENSLNLETGKTNLLRKQLEKLEKIKEENQTEGIIQIGQTNLNKQKDSTGQISTEQILAGQINPTEESNTGQVSGNDGAVSSGNAAEVKEEKDEKEVEYQNVEDDYFSDAVFIGDSRTVGMYEYGGLEEISTFYASKGLTIYKVFEEPIEDTLQKKEKQTIKQALSNRQFAKVYIMLGINEMGQGTIETFIIKYQEVLKQIQELQPNAIIYLQAIIKVTAKRSEKGDYITNEGIEQRNAELEKLADNKTIFYLDVNPSICEETGGLEPSYTTDGVHLKAKYIPLWKEFLQQHAVVLD